MNFSLGKPLTKGEMKNVVGGDCFHQGIHCVAIGESFPECGYAPCCAGLQSCDGLTCISVFDECSL